MSNSSPDVSVVAASVLPSKPNQRGQLRQPRQPRQPHQIGPASALAPAPASMLAPAPAPTPTPPSAPVPAIEQRHRDGSDMIAITKVVIDGLADKIAAIESARTQLEARVIAYEADRANLLATIETERNARYQLIETLNQEHALVPAPPTGRAPYGALVTVGRFTSEYIILRVELAPQVKFIWACDVESIDNEERADPWYEIVAESFEDSLRTLSRQPGAPSDALPYTDVRFSRHCGSPTPSTLVSCYSGEFADGAVRTGYNIVVTNDRLAHILESAAAAVRRTYAGLPLQ